MSLAVAIKGPEGVVLAADSRITLEAQKKGGRLLPVNFDNATKLLSFSKPHNYVGAVTYGAAVIGQRTAHSFVPEFELELAREKTDRLDIMAFSKRLSDFFSKRWEENMPHDHTGPNMTFIVGGYDRDDAYGKVFFSEIPREPIPTPRNPNDFGMTWGGQLSIASRIVHGYDPALLSIIQKTLNLDDKDMNKAVQAIKSDIEFPIPYAVLPLQDCVDLATFLIRSTIIAQDLAVGIRGVGGPIDVAIITRTGGLEYVQQKTIRGEAGNPARTNL